MARSNGRVSLSLQTDGVNGLKLLHHIGKKIPLASWAIIFNADYQSEKYNHFGLKLAIIADRFGIKR